MSEHMNAAHHAHGDHNEVDVKNAVGHPEMIAQQHDMLHPSAENPQKHTPTRHRDIETKQRSFLPVHSSLSFAGVMPLHPDQIA